MSEKRPRPKTNIIETALCAIFPPDWLRNTARETGLTERDPEIDPAAMFWFMTLSFGVSLQQSLANLKRNYGKVPDEAVCDITWYYRFTPELVSFLKTCAAHAIEHLAQEQSRPLNENGNQFQNILIQNSTTVRLHASLSKKWPPAPQRRISTGAKVSCLMSAVADGPKWIDLYPERTRDLENMQIGPWMKDRILLTDIGSYKYPLITSIEENGGYFVSRLKNRDGAVITGTNHPIRGCGNVKGKRLGEVLPTIEGQVLDLDIDLPLRRQSRKSAQKKESKQLRIVAALNEEDWYYHLYVTNISSDVLKPEEIARLYGARLDLDLVFKQLKGRYALDLVDTTRPQIIEAYIWMAHLTLLASKRLYSILSKWSTAKNMALYTQPRWHRTFAEHAGNLKTSIFNHIEIPISLETIASIYDSPALDPQRCATQLREEWWT